MSKVNNSNSSSTPTSSSPCKSTPSSSSPCKVSSSSSSGSRKSNTVNLESCSCKENAGSSSSSSKSPGKFSVSSDSSLQSSDSASGRSVEWLVKTPSCDRHPAPYSEETKRQIPAIKALVAQQEAETAAKEKAAKEGNAGAGAAGGSPVVPTTSTEVFPQVSTTFAQDMVYIQEQIRKGREEWERQEAERKAAKKAKKAAKKAAAAKQEKENLQVQATKSKSGSPDDRQQAQKKQN